jgi:putative colanic acid biosynthesis UDP-glucose lipid carrier transferase
LIIGLIYGLALLQFGFLPNLYLVFGVVLLAVMGIVYDRLGVYRHNRGLTSKILLLVKAWSISFAVLLSIAFISKTSELYSRLFLITFFVVGIFGQLMIHVLSQFIFRKIKLDQQNTNALIIGSGQLSHYLFEKINQNPWIPEKIVGSVDPSFDEEKRHKVRNINEHVKNDFPVLGGLYDVIQLLETNNIRTVYFAVPLDSSPIIEELYFSLLDKNVDIHWAPNIFALNLVNHSVKELAGIPIITLSETPMSGINLILKTIEDIIFSFFGLLLISPVLLVTAIAIKLDSSGPVFFKQDRTGWNGKNFKIWKFRTMQVHEADTDIIQQATKYDPRITRVGKFLRRTSIDELPQLINVLQGSMSLVGPRPHAVSHNELYSKKIEAYLARHKIKPGISGLAQVRGYRGETKELDQMTKRVESDLEYINNWSLWLDLTILFRTVITLFSKNAY